jgi:hypothetical protein
LLDLAPVETPSLMALGGAHGALLGVVLALLGLVARRLRRFEQLGSDFAVLGPLPLLAYFFSRSAARQKYLRRPRRPRITKAPTPPPNSAQSDFQIGPYRLPPPDVQL